MKKATGSYSTAGDAHKAAANSVRVKGDVSYSRKTGSSASPGRKNKYARMSGGANVGQGGSSGGFGAGRSKTNKGKNKLGAGAGQTV